MIKKTINITLKELNESYVKDLFSNLKKRQPIALSISSSFYTFHLTKELDKEIYNTFDFVLIERGEYTFSLNRDLISSFINLTKDYSLSLLEITPLIEDELLTTNMNNFYKIEKINFLTSDYIVEKKFQLNFNKISRQNSYFFFSSTIFFLSINFFSYYIYNKSTTLKKEIEISQNKIRVYEEQIIEISNNYPPDLSNILSDQRIKIYQLLEKINNSSNKGIFFKKIEIQPDSITISGSSRELNDFFLFEEELEKNGIKQLNNDYVKKIDNFYDFTIDGIIGGN